MFHLMTDVDFSASYQADPTTSTVGSLVGYLIFTLVALRPVFVKAGYNGWSALIPIYNIYVLVKIGGFHGATVLLYLIPIVNIVFGIILAVRIGKNFGKGGAFSFFLLWLLSFIGYCIIGYGSAVYQGPARVKA